MSHTESPQIRALRERYKSSLADKIEIIQQQIESVLSSVGDAESIAETQDVLHKLAGSSGMYGYNDVNALCREVMAGLGDLSVDESVNGLNKVIELLEQHQ